MKTDFTAGTDNWFFCFTPFHWGIGFGGGYSMGDWDLIIEIGPFYLQYSKL